MICRISKGTYVVTLLVMTLNEMEVRKEIMPLVPTEEIDR